MKVKQRISHFTTRKIEVNQTTRPSAQGVWARSTKASIGISTQSKSRGIEVEKKSFGNKLAQIEELIRKRKPTQALKETIGVIVESNYAAKPKKEESESLREVIKRVITAFRNAGQVNRRIQGNLRRIRSYTKSAIKVINMQNTKQSDWQNWTLFSQSSTTSDRNCRVITRSMVFDDNDELQNELKQLQQVEMTSNETYVESLSREEIKNRNI